MDKSTIIVIISKTTKTHIISFVNVLIRISVKKLATTNNRVSKSGYSRLKNSNKNPRHLFHWRNPAEMRVNLN